MHLLSNEHVILQTIDSSTSFDKANAFIEFQIDIIVSTLYKKLLLAQHRQESICTEDPFYTCNILYKLFMYDALIPARWSNGYFCPPGGPHEQECV